MKSGTVRRAPTQGQKVSILPVSPSELGSVVRARNRISAGNAGELVHAVVRRRLQLIPVVHAVEALELGIVRNGVSWSAPVVVNVEPHGLVEQREEEQVRGRAGVSALTRAVH